MSDSTLRPNAADDDEYTDSNHDGGNNEVTDSPKIIIFIVEGLEKQIDHNQIDWELFGRLEGPQSKMVHIRLLAEQAISDADPYNGMMNQAKSLLDIVLPRLAFYASKAPHASPIALGFFASDLAASIVKKALVIASEDSHYSSIVDQTSLLVFFGALHRVSAARTWETALIECTNAYCEDLAIPNFLDLVGRLASFHRELSPEYDALMRCQSMRTVDYYEMDSGWKSDNECLVARLYQDQIRSLGRSIQDEIDRLKIDYLGGLELLALHSPISHMRPGHSMEFENLSNCILARPDFKQWLQDATLPPLPRPAWAQSNNTSLVPRNMLAVKLVNHFLDLDIMTNAFICSIVEMNDLSHMIHIILRPETMTRGTIPTRGNLMASICHQLLVARPSLFTHIKSIMAGSRDILQGTNMECIDRILALCVKSLLIGAHTVSVIIIIEQPEDPRVAALFLDLIYLIKCFIETTEATARIIILSRAAHQGVTIEDSIIAAPVCWDFDDIGIPTMKIDIDPTSPEIRDALIEDYTEIINDSSHYNDQSQIFKADAELLALNNLTKLEAFRAAVTLARKPSLYPFKPRECIPDFDKLSHNVVSRILDLLPKSMQKIAWAGLHWLITAHRPLTCQEFAAILQLEENDAATEIINYDQVTLRTASVFEFVSLFYGLVEVNKNRMCLSAVLQSHLSNDKSEENAISQASFQTLSSAREEITRRCYTYLHSWLHKDTTKNATPSATKEREQTKQERSQIPALLPYAIEHWFEFLQSDYCNGEGKAMTPMLMKAVEEFVVDETTLNRCLHVYKSKGNSTYFPWNIIIPSLSWIQKRLGLSIKDAMALVLAPIRRHGSLALDNGWQYVGLGVIESNNEAVLLKADRCKILDDEEILKVAFEIASDKSSCVLAKSHPDFVQKHSAKLISDAIRLGNSSFITYIISQGVTLIEDFGVPGDGVTILCSIAEFIAPIPHPILWQKYLRYARHVSEAHRRDKRSPLHLAAMRGYRLFIQEAITWIKDHEIVPAEALNDRDRSGATALFLASQHGHSDIVAQLLAAGANLAICNKQKQSPLHIACKMGNSKIVAKLVAAGAKLDEQDRLKKTPLHLALENRHTAAAANLLLDCTLATLRYQRPEKHGRNGQHVDADAITGTTLSETPSEELLSHFFTLSPDSSIVGTAKSREITIALPFETTRILVSKSSVSVSATKSNQKINVNLKDADGATPLIIATKHNMVDIVKILLRYDVDVCAKDQPHGQEAIQYAAKYGHTEILELLLASMPSQRNINSDWQISSPLHLACRGGHVSSIQSLVKYGLNPNITDNEGRTALLEASQLNLFNIVEVLIHARANINSVDGFNSTALHDCASNNNPKLMQLLISKGANVNTMDNSHRTPVFIAAGAGRLRCLKDVDRCRC